MMLTSLVATKRLINPCLNRDDVVIGADAVDKTVEKLWSSFPVIFWWVKVVRLPSYHQVVIYRFIGRSRKTKACFLRGIGTKSPVVKECVHIKDLSGYLVWVQALRAIIARYRVQG